MIVPKAFSDDVAKLHARLAADQKSIGATPSSRSEFIVGLLRRGIRAVVEEAEAKAKVVPAQDDAVTPAIV